MAKMKRKYTKKVAPNPCREDLSLVAPNPCREDLSLAAYWKLEGKKCKKAAIKVNKGKVAAKPSTELSKVSDLGEQDGGQVIKRPIGRPRKHPLNVGPMIKRKRGRPKKYVPEVGVREVQTKTSRHFGHCEQCLLNICTLDIRFTKYSCPRCGNIGLVSKLKPDLNIDRPKTKKEYLQTVNSVWSNWYDKGTSPSSKALPSVEETVELPPMKEDEEELLEKEDKDDHEKI